MQNLRAADIRRFTCTARRGGSLRALSAGRLSARSRHRVQLPQPQYAGGPAAHRRRQARLPATARLPAAAAEEPAARAELKGTLRGRDRAKKEKKDAKAAADNGGPLEGLKSILVAVLLFFVIRTFIVTAYSIPSESMEETLLVGDYLMANNALFGATIPFTDIKLPALRDPAAARSWSSGPPTTSRRSTW